MGHIWMTPDSCRANLSEDAGVRSGFALTSADLDQQLGHQHPVLQQLTEAPWVRLASDAYADAVGDLLFALGTVQEPGTPTLGMRIIRQLGDDWRSAIDVEPLLRLEAIANHYVQLRSRHAPERHEIHAELRRETDAAHPSLWPQIERACEETLAYNPFLSLDHMFKDLVSLQDLFGSERLPAEPDHFFDQRFINYLAGRPSDLQRVHWRQFEGLTAEWFSRQGYEVELGTGRKDGGVDIRLWKADPERHGPPTIIVQCKRVSAMVDAITVKALYADLLATGAAEAMLVTTSKLSPDAERTCLARNYPITSANLGQVRAWIGQMRRSGVGLV